MTELAFTKSFLSALDARPVKLRADYVFDPQSIGLRVPYTLPRLNPSQHPQMPKKVKTAQPPGASKSITIHLKSARNPVLQFTVDNAPLSTTTVEDLKDAVHQRVVADPQTGAKVPLDKIKILYKRKPVTGKTVAEVLADEPDALAGGKEVELGVMIMGRATVVSPEAPPAAAAAAEKPEAEAQPVQLKAAQGPSGEEVLKSDAFWDDLRGFLAQRIKDETEATRLKELFKKAWEEGR
ncbi:hypothetical protein VTN00DRAFT_3374 [Thermoascus crustaceus]|uniref:uncharacterized protein n=1 Tax=Thermoascus crustaceus TaxID=5088 RepID=UPI003741F89E